MAVDPFKQGLVANFAVEAAELCEALTRNVLELEKLTATSPALLPTYDQLARCLHTLKGSSATLGLNALSELAHRMEDLVLKRRKEKQPLTAEAVDALLKSVDVFNGQVRSHADGETKASPMVGETSRMLERMMEGQPAAAPAPEKPATAPAQPTQASGTVVAPTAPVRPAEAKPEAARPEISRPEAPLPPAREGGGGGGGADDAGSWRVATRHVISLMREVERLREVRLRLDERRRQMEHVISVLIRMGMPSETAEARAAIVSIQRHLVADGEEAADIVDSLEEGLKAICTLPVRTVLEPLHRAVRDLCRQSGKEARLEVVGAEVSLDRRVLESLRAPLVHLIRNAVDHGVERPEDRERRGKHREGALVIRVEQQGNVLFLEVSDDGNGLDTERIRAEAGRRGLIPADQLAAMHTTQINELIFYSGFSTSTKVTETSGRGYGLDVVRSQLQALQGQIEVQSIAGRGTRFIMTLPAELGSSPVLVVRCGEHDLGLPLLAVEHIRAARQKEIRVSANKVQLEYREQLLSVQDLGSIVGLRQPQQPHEGQPMLIVQTQGRRLALSVDEVLGDWDLVIRPLPPEVREVPAYQGSATLADGKLMLVLRPDWIVDKDRQAEGPKAAAGRRALVVDDSLTARALHRTMLEAGGFVVHTSSSAKQALEQLRSASYDVVVCDIGMEDMDGMALTAAIRGRAETRSLPVILVSAHDSEADRSKGMASGADGFLSKRDCEAGRLLAEVSAVIARRRATT